MCMSTAYEHRAGEDVVICSNIKEAKITGNTITFIDIMGYTTTFKGIIQTVDLVNNKMMVAPCA